VGYKTSQPRTVGIKAASHLLNLTEGRVRTLCDQGRLPCTRDGENRRVIKMADVARLMRQRQKLPASRSSEV
jgi:hypothetical protein